MQYILTEEEYKNLVPKKLVEERDAALRVARQMIEPRCVNHPYAECACFSCPIGERALGTFSGYTDADAEAAELICKLDKDYPK